MLVWQLIILLILLIMKLEIRVYIFLLIATITASCATMVQPSGGPIDTTAPVPESFEPANASMNMHKKKIIIRFDEYIILDKLSQQMVVSPQMPEDPKVNINGKKLIINLPDSLRPNTTYTIFFGDAVVNYKENLPVHNFSYVFSTGSVVDSLRLQGIALKAFDHSVYKELYVMLYKADTDSAIYKHKPYYLCKAEKDGHFFLNNLAAGKYQIYALKDENRNYIYDQPNEEIAFADSLVVPYYDSPYKETTIDSAPPPIINPVSDINMFVFKEIPKRTILISNKTYPPRKAIFVFNRAVNNLSITPLDFISDTIWHKEVYSKNRDTITTFLMAIKQDTIHIALAADGENLDTLELILVKKKHKILGRKSRRRNNTAPIKPKTKPIPKISYTTNISSEFPFFNNIVLKFKVPLTAFDLSRIELYKARDTLWIPIKHNSYLSDTTNRLRINIDAVFGEREKYKLLIRDSSFFDLYSATNDSLQKEFFTTEMRQYGSLKLEVNYDNKDRLIVQLLNSKEAILQENTIDSSQVIYYPYLPDGKYKIKAIVDKNKNGKWDTGDLQKKLQAEPIYYVPKVIDIRANWDTEHIWEIVP